MGSPKKSPLGGVIILDEPNQGVDDAMSRIEPDRLASLFRNHAPALLLYARQWSATPEDLVQEAFLNLSTQRQTPDRPVAWLHRVVRNASLDQKRGNARRTRREHLAASDERWFLPQEDGIDAQTATLALDALAAEVREVIVARIWGGLTFEEIAKLVGVSLSHVYRRYHAGLAELRNRMEGRWTTAPQTN
jgi:RNA polymerase sigma-70 factor (ECF subfamily)